MPRPKKIAAIVLAAGGSSRLGFPKQLLIYDGEPLISRAASAALGSGASPVIVVLGADAELVAPALARVPDVTTVVNDNWRAGLASSLLRGLSTLEEIADCDAVLLTLVDQPRVRSDSLVRLLNAFDADHRLIAAQYGGIIGVPAIFGREFFDDLLRLTGDRGAGQWLRAHADRVTTVPLPEAQMDIDTVADLHDPVAISHDEVHLWETSLLVEDDELHRAHDLLSPEERRYAARFTNERAKNQFVVSRAKLRELLAKYAGLGPRDLSFGMTREGKPFLESAREFEFNLTHSADLVLYGVARSRPVGVDVERVREMPRAVELVKRFMSAEEHERVAAAPEDLRHREFLSCWVRREGSGKAYGVGVWKVLENGSRTGTERNPLFSQITSDYHCKVIDYSEHYVAAVAALGTDWNLVLRGKL